MTPEQGDAATAAPTTATASPAPVDHDPARRAFFRQFGRQAVTTAGQVAGMADIVGRTTGGATAGLLGLLGVTEPRPRGATPVARRPVVSAGTSVAGVAAADSAYRSPFRLEGDTLRILDQRLIPDALEEIVARRGSDVVHYLRRGVFGGGPMLAQLAAYGQALTAKERGSQPAALRDQELERTRAALLEHRPASRSLRWALERQDAVVRRSAAAATPASGPELAAALRNEADAIAAEIQLGLSASGDLLAATISDQAPAGGPIGVLIHGDPGALRGGLVGSGIVALRRLRQDGRELHVLVTEARPSEEGLRLASWELRQAGIDHTIVPDTAAAWVLGQEPVDVILVSAECVAANGDSAAVLGSRALAHLVAVERDRRGTSTPRLLVTALTSAIDLDIPDGSAIPTDVPYPKGQRDPRVLPGSDVIAANHISALITERGVVAPVTSAGVVELVAGTAIDDRPAAADPI
jgi:methylthioribose-1-phosphate isomerase